MQIIVVIIPSFAEVFKLVPLNQTQWLYTLGISVLPLIVVQFKKKLDEIKSGIAYTAILGNLPRGRSFW